MTASLFVQPVEDRVVESAAGNLLEHQAEGGMVGCVVDRQVEDRTTVNSFEQRVENQVEESVTGGLLDHGFGFEYLVPLRSLGV